MLPTTEATLLRDHPVPRLRAVRPHKLEIALHTATHAQNAFDLGDVLRLVVHYVTVKIVPGLPTDALLNFTENDSPSSSVSAEP